jgi:hypothetical protein
MVTYQDIYINQGSTYVESMTLTDDYKLPINLLDYDVQARMSRSTSAHEYISITVATNDPANGVIELSLTSNETANLKSIKYIYELVAIDSVNNVSKLMEGLAIVNSGVGLMTNKYSISY